MEIIRGPDDFFRDQHQTIYTAIINLHAAGEAIDCVTLAEWLIRKGYWNEIGEEETLREIVEATPNAANTIFYAQIVREKALAREVVEQATKVLSDAYSNAFTADQLVTSLRQTAERLESVTTGWNEPNLDGMPPAAPFPLEALPLGLRNFAVAAAASFPCPPDFIAIPCLAVAAGAIGRSMALKVKESWIESPSLYVAFCSAPGSTKSAAVKVAIRPLMEIQQKELSFHHLAITAMKEAKRADPSCEPVPPKLKRTLVGDTTVEKLAVILSENPRGVTMIHDELTAWLDGMGQYKQGGGNDRQFYLSAWAGAAVSIDRKNQENGVPLFLPHPTLSIAGAMTPDMLRPCLDNGGKEDGFTDRILIGYPEMVEVRYTEDTIPEDVTEAWSEAIKALWHRRMMFTSEGRDRPDIINFTSWGQEAFKKWFNAHCEESEQDDFPRHLRGPWAKMRGYCARLALVLECLDRAYDPTSTGSPSGVSVEALQRAIEIIDYFKAHARRVHFLIQGHNVDNADARAILKWATGREGSRFTEREVRDCFRRRFAAHPEGLPEALAWLADRNCVRKLAVPSGRAGRKPSDTFEVHPQILESARKTRKTPNVGS